MISNSGIIAIPTGFDCIKAIELKARPAAIEKLKKPLFIPRQNPQKIWHSAAGG
jgi:hypothetical protein